MMLNRKILLLSVLLALVASSAAITASCNAVSGDFIKGGIQAAENSSYNNSSICFAGQNDIVSTPVDLTAGSGYYSSHPIAIGPGIGSRTQLGNGNSATSMSHEVRSARKISGRTEYAVTASSSQGDFESTSFATTHMQIDETVTSGRVHIGVLSGSDDSRGSSGNGMMNAWKDPAIEIEEEYIGTYHITENFTINNSYGRKNRADGWLDCCGEGFDIHLPEPAFISADDVFNFRSRKINMS
jgi:opacity protein-like surface antigen